MSNALTKAQILALWQKFKKIRRTPNSPMPWYMGRWRGDEEPFARDNGRDGRKVLSEERECLERYANRLHIILREACQQLEVVEPLLKEIQRGALEVCSVCKGKGGVKQRGYDGWTDCSTCDGWGMVTKVN